MNERFKAILHNLIITLFVLSLFTFWLSLFIMIWGYSALGSQILMSSIVVVIGLIAAQEFFEKL